MDSLRLRTALLDLCYAPGAPWSETGWNNKEIGRLPAKAKAETDPKVKHELLCQMQKIVAQDLRRLIAHGRFTWTCPMKSSAGFDKIEHTWIEMPDGTARLHPWAEARSWAPSLNRRCS